MLDKSIPRTSTPSIAKAPLSPSQAPSRALLDLVLAADKTAFVEKLPAREAKVLQDRAFAKQVALNLQLSPYGAPNAVIIDRLRQDPVIRERLPNISMKDLEVLRQSFPGIVPNPNVPLDFGHACSPNLEGHLDIIASMYVQASSRRDQLAQRFKDYSIADPNKYFGQRFKHERGYLQLNNVPATRVSQSETEAIRKALGGEGPGFYLRRAIINAPPHFAPKEIAEEHNRDIDYYACLMWWGDGDSVEKAKARARVTPEQVVALMNRAPNETGAKIFAERQAQLRSAIAEELGAAKSGENLYSLLDRICERLEKASVLLPGTKQVGRRGESDWMLFATPPPVTATLTPEQVLGFIQGEPTFADKLGALLSDRRDNFDRQLAEKMAKTLGSRAARMSLSEITQVMKKQDPSFNDHTVQHLISSFPDLFGALKVERSRVEMNFLLANQVADAMGKMFVGATLDDVAKFMKAQSPDFAAAFPDFAAEDVRLLQAAYPFLPQWDKRTDAVSPSATQGMPLDGFLRFATQHLGKDEGAAIGQAVIETIAKDVDTPDVPPELDARLTAAFRRAALKRAADAVGIRPLSAYDPNSSYPLLLDFIAGRPSPTMSHAALVSILSDPKGLGFPAEKASAAAMALLKADSLDFVGLADTLSAALVGNPNAETEFLKVSNLALGYEAIHTRLERDVFKNSELKAAFKRFARIPLRLPMIQHVVDKYKEDQPLKDTNVLMVQHMLGQAYPQIGGYKALGMNPEDAIFVGIPYHKNVEVEQAVAKSFGLVPRVPPRDMQALYSEIERSVDDLVKKHLENAKKMLVVCDGPTARDYFKKKYPYLLDQVHFTEQTAFGDRPEYRNDKAMHVVSYARTDLKAKKEAKFIGQAVVRAVNAVETQLKTGHEQKPVLILGFGPIGQATAEAFAGDRASVYVYDPYMTPEMEKLAKDGGYTVVKDKKTIADGKFMLIGCSGHLSIDEEQIMSSDPNAIYVSASSKLVEINMKKLAELATDDQGRIRKVLAAEVNNQQTWHYWLKDGTIRTVIADGLPANFNDINSVPPEWIDMTMSLSLAAAVQSIRGQEKGYVSLNDGDQKELLELHEQLVERIHGEAKAAASAEAPAS